MEALGEALSEGGLKADALPKPGTPTVCFTPLSASTAGCAFLAASLAIAANFGSLLRTRSKKQSRKTEQ